MNANILHIGWPKCGSTSLQSAIWSQYRTIGKVEILETSQFSDVNWIDSGLESLRSDAVSTQAALNLEDPVGAGGTSIVGSSLAISFGKGFRVVSSEHLVMSRKIPSEEHRHVFCIVRDPLSWLWSRWQHEIIWSPIETPVPVFENWLDSVGSIEFLSLCEQTRLWSRQKNFHVFNFPNVAAAWMALHLEIEKCLGITKTINSPQIRSLNSGLNPVAFEILIATRRLAEKEALLTTEEWRRFSWLMKRSQSLVSEDIRGIPTFSDDYNSFENSDRLADCGEEFSKLTEDLGLPKAQLSKSRYTTQISVRKNPILEALPRLLLEMYTQRVSDGKPWRQGDYTSSRRDVVVHLLQSDPKASLQDFRQFLKYHYHNWGANETRYS